MTLFCPHHVLTASCVRYQSADVRQNGISLLKVSYIKFEKRDNQFFADFSGFWEVTKISGSKHWMGGTSGEH